MPATRTQTPPRAPAERRRPAALATALLLALPFALTACTAAGSGGDAAAPRSGGRLTFALSSDPTCVDPHQAATNDAMYVTRGLVDSLTDQDPKTGRIVPWIASSWEVGKDASRFTFRLRTDATFGDGTPLDAKAVKANFDAVHALGARSILGSGFLQGYRQTRVVDAHTVEVAFDGPNAQFLQATSTPSLGLLSPASLRRTPEERCTGPLVGSGPFTLKTYTPDTSVELERRGDYAWGSSLWKSPGAARLDGITFRIVPESGVRSGSLTSGQVDAVAGVAPQDEALLKGQKVSVVGRANPGVPVALSANTASPVAKDPAVRRALQAAVDRDEVVDTVLSPSYRPATSSLAATTDGYRDHRALLAHDVARAKSLLEEAGWRAGDDGIRVKDGRRLELKVILGTNFGPNQSALELIQQQVKKAGIQLTLSVLSIADYQKARGAGDYDLAWGNGTRTDPDILRTAFSSKLLNLSRISDTTLQRDLDAQAAATDPARRAAHVAAAQRRILEQGYQIPVFEMTSVIALSRDVHDLTFDSSSRLQFHDTWLS
ncbi:ABC transporter substrate-binding protein [Streptomyces sp. NPDC058052]|uniref:ABC transporter substrate-binding protein n=1 Tax=Streptomyces sp. NPDC058052 TaxID=3346316 RepID=UPI0036EF1BDC